MVPTSFMSNGKPGVTKFVLQYARIDWFKKKSGTAVQNIKISKKTLKNVPFVEREPLE